jgi:hypothetical protein
LAERSDARKFWGILCEKSRFYAKNHIFSNFRGEPETVSEKGYKETVQVAESTILVVSKAQSHLQ